MGHRSRRSMAHRPSFPGGTWSRTRVSPMRTPAASKCVSRVVRSPNWRDMRRSWPASCSWLKRKKNHSLAQIAAGCGCPRDHGRRATRYQRLVASRRCASAAVLPSTSCAEHLRISEGQAGEGEVVVSADSLTRLGAESLLLGGRRSSTSDGTAIDVFAQSVTVDAGTSLSAPEILIAAADTVTVQSNARTHGHRHSCRRRILIWSKATAPCCGWLPESEAEVRRSNETRERRWHLDSRTGRATGFRHQWRSGIGCLTRYTFGRDAGTHRRLAESRRQSDQSRRCPG